MNVSSESDIIEIDRGGGGVERGESQAASSSPTSAAAAVASAGSDGEGGAEWQMVTRAKAKGGASKKGGTFNFEAISAVERKRKAESSVDDRLVALTQTIKELMTAQREMTETQKQMTESQKVLTESNRTLMETIKAQADEINALKAIVTNNVRQPSYSETVASRKATDDGVGRPKQADNARSTAAKQSSPRVRDERAVPIDVGRYKGAKTDFAAIKAKLQESVKVNKVTEGLTVRCLRPGPGDRIEVVFENKEEASKAKTHTRWLTSGMPGARVAGEQWYPVKCDNVVKQCVLDEGLNDGKTLKKDFLQEFRADNKCEAAECTAMKATWLSRVDVTKKVGSLVVWLRNKVDADYLLRTGTAMFGATGAYCSSFVIKDNSGPCYHCNRYGHKQASCTSHVRCAICAKGHRRDDCTNRDSPKCPACGEGHTIFDWACKLHPQHWRYVGQQKAKAGQVAPRASRDVEMEGARNDHL